MASQPSDYVNVLLKRSLVSPDQVTEAEELSKTNNIPLGESLVSLNYVTGEDVCRAMAEHYALDYVNLSEIKIPESVVELVPETIARENITIPLSEEGDALRVILADPIPSGEPSEMMQAATNAIADLAARYPEQYFWVHRRWRDRTDI